MCRAMAQGIQARRLLLSVYGVQQSPQLFKRNQNEINSTWLYLDRVDDRGGDYRYSGGGCAASVSGLHHTRESVGRSGLVGRSEIGGRRNLSVERRDRHDLQRRSELRHHWYIASPGDDQRIFDKLRCDRDNQNHLCNGPASLRVERFGSGSLGWCGRYSGGG